MKAEILTILFFCHYIADFTWLSTPWMLNAKRDGKPLLPILAHAATHAVIMGVAVWLYISLNTGHWKGLMVNELLAVLFQLTTHFLIDVLKGKANVWFPVVQNPANKWHWVVFGFDQYLHAVVIICMTFFIY